MSSQTTNSAFKTRAEREADNSLLINVLVLSLVLVFLGFLPQARSVIGILLCLIGSLVQGIGQSVIEEQNINAGQLAHSDDFPFTWVFGLLVLISPYAIWYLARVTGWQHGMNQASAEVKDARSPY